MSSTPVPASTSWIDVSPSSFSPSDLIPYSFDEIGHLFDWGENPNGLSAHVIPYRGQLLVDIVQIGANAVHQPCKPGDEVVLVANGTLILTTDSTKREQVFKKNEAVLIPRGWAGLYRVEPKDGPFLEFTIVPANYFDKSLNITANGLHPIRLEQPVGVGKQEMYKGMYTVEAEARDTAATWDISTRSDTIVIVRAGELTLSLGSDGATFGAGNAVCLPAGFSGQASTSPGYRALIARWPD